MRVLVLGGGSIGGLFAAKLHDSHTVEVAIAPSRRQEVRAAIAERGIEISGLTSILAPVPVVAPDFRGVDVVLVCVKDADVDAIAETLSKDSSNEFIVVSAQNGIR